MDKVTKDIENLIIQICREAGPETIEELCLDADVISDYGDFHPATKQPDLSLFVNLKVLSLNKHFLRTFDARMVPSGVEVLEISMNELFDIAGIDRMTGLKKLDLSLNNLEQVTIPPGLEKVDLSHNQLKRLELQGKSYHLESLNISGNTSLRHIDGLREVKKLKKLHYKKVYPDDHSFLRGSFKLDELGFSLRDADQLRSLNFQDELQHLFVDLQADLDVSGWKPAGKLEILRFKGNGYKLSGLTLSPCGLREVSITDCGLQSLPAGTGTANTEKLDLSSNRITDPGLFGQWPKLRQLNLSGNPLNGMAMSRLIAARPDVEIIFA